MNDILNMCCAILAKITGRDEVNALGPIIGVLVLLGMILNACERLIWGDKFWHAGDVGLIVLALAFYLKHLAFLADLKGRAGR